MIELHDIGASSNPICEYHDLRMVRERSDQRGLWGSNPDDLNPSDRLCDDAVTPRPEVKYGHVVPSPHHLLGLKSGL